MNNNELLNDINIIIRIIDALYNNLQFDNNKQKKDLNKIINLMKNNPSEVYINDIKHIINSINEHQLFDTYTSINKLDISYNNRIYNEIVKGDNNIKNSFIRICELYVENTKNTNLQFDKEVNYEKPLTIKDVLSNENRKRDTDYLYVSSLDIDNIINRYHLDNTYHDIIENSLKVKNINNFFSKKLNKNDNDEIVKYIINLNNIILNNYTDLVLKSNDRKISKLNKKVSLYKWINMYSSAYNKINNYRNKLKDKTIIDHKIIDLKRLYPNDFESNNNYLNTKEYIVNRINKEIIDNITSNKISFVNAFRKHKNIDYLYNLTRLMNINMISELYKICKNYDVKDERTHERLQYVFVEVIKKRLDSYDKKFRKNDEEKIQIAKEYLGEEYLGKIVSTNNENKINIKFKEMSVEAKDNLEERYFNSDKLLRTYEKVKNWKKYKYLMNKEVLNEEELSDINNMFVKK